MKFNVKKYLDSNEFKLIALIFIIILILQQSIAIVVPLILGDNMPDADTQMVQQAYFEQQFYVWLNNIKENVLGNVTFTIILFVLSLAIAKILEKYI